MLTSDTKAYMERWKVFDGYAFEDRDDRRFEINVREGTGEDSFRVDLAQDVLLDTTKSSVTIFNGYATFKVHFRRKFITRGVANDARLKVGEKIKLEYMYK